MALPMKAMKTVQAKAVKAGKAMKAMKAMKAKKPATASGVMSTAGAYSSIAEKTGLKSKDVRSAIEGVVAIAAQQLKACGKFKFGGALNLKLKKKPATAARKGVNPFTKEPCVFKAKPASKTVRALPMKKFKEMVN